MRSEEMRRLDLFVSNAPAYIKRALILYFQTDILCKK